MTLKTIFDTGVLHADVLTGALDRAEEGRVAA